MNEKEIHIIEEELKNPTYSRSLIDALVSDNRKKSLYVETLLKINDELRCEVEVLKQTINEENVLLD